MSPILLPLLCLVLQGIVLSEAREPYQVPLVPVTNRPIVSLYQYPLEGNRFKQNDTHVFWPSNRRIFSKFYIHLKDEQETLFGISEQNFIEVGITSRIGATMGTNDHTGFVKVVGPWSEGTVENNDDDDDNNGYSYSAMDQMPLEERLSMQRMKIDLLFKWLHVANITSIIHTQTVNEGQLPALQYAVYNSDLGKKLLGEMEEFSSGLSHTDYKQFDKSAVMCLHINPGGIEASREEDGESGWWLPLHQNFAAWRVMGYQKPLQKIRTSAGLLSMSIESGNLNVVYEGTQMWHVEIDGLDWTNMRVDISPPNSITHNIPDTRPQPPPLPLEPFATAIRGAMKSLPVDFNLPWLPRHQLCPDLELRSRHQQLAMACGYPFTPTEDCQAAFAIFYPCYNFYLRPSRSHNHGMDSLMEFATIVHLFIDFPPSYWLTLAIDHPWDEVYAQAVDVLGLYH